MRILHIISRMDPAGGGPQEAVRLLLRYAPAGCEQEVVTLDDPDAAFLQSGTEPIHALGGSGTGFAAPQLTRWLRTERGRFDGIILHGMWEYTSFAVLRAIAGRKPYVVFPHGMLDPYFKRASPLKHLKKWLYWLPVQYWTLRNAHRVLFTTTAERELAARSFWMHRWKPMVVAIGADAPPADLKSCADAFFQRCPAMKGKRFLLFLGRIDPKKGCDLLIEAFGTLKGRGFSPALEGPESPWALAPEGMDASTMQDLHLVIAGPDPENWGEQLRTTTQTGGIAHRIHFPGMLQGDAKWGAFAACEAFILPSHQENFGIAVVEAIACSKPVLITHPVNISADLANDGCALVEEDTLAGTERLLARWLQLSPGQRAKMGESALNSFAKRYDMRMNAHAILQCFEGLTDTAAPEVEA